ncbi:glycosyltransferase [Abyssisolibacter fermentans]|uniref:glycosyltransferase n=1 Tax=Abyssisolibacter fermentans TaxID=1766203 RepID=UPI000835F083|nr:glycosyltransferase [Abyssisolibacter fermentans]
MLSKNNIYKLPINKSVKLNYSNKIININDEDAQKFKVSVICCTNKNETLDNIKKNYFRQNLVNKELIIILNNNNINNSLWKKELSKFDNIYVYQLDQAISLGECLNYAISKAQYSIIAKFDDDDYYGSRYLIDSVKPFLYTDAKVVGKYTTYIYFKKDKILAIRNPKREQMYTYRVEGSTLLIKKEVFNVLKFSNKNLGEDVQFCKDCIDNGFKIYSHNKLHHVYIRHGNTHNHTFKMQDSLYQSICKKIAITDDYEKYLNF